MGPTQWSTVASDGVLAAVCWYYATKLPSMAAIAFVLFAIPATVGVIRHSGTSGLVDVHKKATLAGSIIGMPLLGLAAQPQWAQGIPLPAIVGALAVLYVVRISVGEKLKPLDLIGAITLVAFGLTQKSDFIVAAAAIAFSTLVVRGDGFVDVLGQRFRKVDLFHYCFAVALYLTAKAL